MNENNSTDFVHASVLLEESIENLNIKPDGIYVDGTMGGAGHSLQIAKRLSDQGRLIAIDQDGDAIRAGSARLEPYSDRTLIVRNNFSFMKEIVKNAGYEHVDGILLDLGVSSYQLDNSYRGFTYRDENAPLDMRMDDRDETTAKDIVNGYSEEDLSRIIKTYGEDRYAPYIASKIVKRRQIEEIATTGQLVDTIRSAYPARELKKPGHPAKKTFQAIRIELNNELKVLEDNLKDMIGLLDDGGRICVITFHSLEDRIVKNIFREAENPCICPPDFPVCVCGRKPLGKVVTRKPIVPGREELENNPRAKSSKLRVFERVM